MKVHQYGQNVKKDSQKSPQKSKPNDNNAAASDSIALEAERVLFQRHLVRVVVGIARAVLVKVLLVQQLHALRVVPIVTKCQISFYEFYCYAWFSVDFVSESVFEKRKSKT